MGFFLNTKGNLKEDANGRQPDENYAREVMQLFTIGLLRAQSRRHAAARRQQPAHRDLRPERHHQPGARVHGLRLGLPGERRHVHQRGLARLRRAEHALRHQPDVVQPEQPLEPRGELPRHEHSGQHAGSRSAAHRARPAVQSCEHRAVLRAADDPAPGDQQSVACVRGARGRGVRQQWLGRARRSAGRCGPRSSWTTEARTAPSAAEHAVRQIARARGALRAVGAHRRRQLHQRRVRDLRPVGSDTALGQSALRSPSVFNFFRPGYVPPNTEIATAGKQAPEFQLLNETTTAGYINFLQWATRGGYNDVKPDLRGRCCPSRTTCRRWWPG